MTAQAAGLLPRYLRLALLPASKAVPPVVPAEPSRPPVVPDPPSRGGHAILVQPTLPLSLHMQVLQPSVAGKLSPALCT